MGQVELSDYLPRLKLFNFDNKNQRLKLFNCVQTNKLCLFQKCYQQTIDLQMRSINMICY